MILCGSQDCRSTAANPIARNSASRFEVTPGSIGLTEASGIAARLGETEFLESGPVLPPDSPLQSLASAFDPRHWRPNPGPRFRLRGRLETDVIGADQNAANQATFGDLPDRVGLRRARIGAEGNLTPDSRYVGEIDLASGQVVLRDLYLGWGTVQETGEFKSGHYREPFSLEGGTSANSFAFMERSPINTLDPARNWGFSYNRCGLAENWTFDIGVFQAGTDASDIQGGVGSNTAITGRVTMLGWNEDHGRRLLHLGMAVSERIQDFGVVTISQAPRSPLLELSDSTESPFVPKIQIPANFQQLINLQCALVNGPCWTQAEWYGTVIDQLGGPPIFYHGCHFDTGWFLTGEHRSYLTKGGVLGPVNVNHPVLSGFSSKHAVEELGAGAWEATARVAYLDFLDSNTPVNTQGQAVGVTMPDITVGMNWYLADRLRIMFNYTYALPNEVNTGPSTVSIFGTRFAMFW